MPTARHQTFLGVQALGHLAIDGDAVAPEQYVQSTIAEPSSLSRQLVQPIAQICLPALARNHQELHVVAPVKRLAKDLSTAIGGGMHDPVYKTADGPTFWARVFSFLDGQRSGRETDGANDVWQVSIRPLAVATVLLCALAQGLSLTGREVIGQALWNATVVGFLLLLLCVCRLDQRKWVLALSISITASLPFAIYALSPGGRTLSVAILLVCFKTLARNARGLSIAIVNVPTRSRPIFGKVELLALVCNLLCAMYNFVGSRLWPNWSRIYENIGALTGFTPDLAQFASGMYTLGLDGVNLPSNVDPGAPTSGFGALVFLLIWTFLPTLYVLYFAILAKLAERSPGMRVQQALCLLGIFHFLFLTDFVDYRFGRGIENHLAIWCHWIEVLVWRIAILLPIYQKIATGDWRRGNGTLGMVVHYTIGAWAVFFLVYEVLLFDVVRFYCFVMGYHFTPLKLFGIWRPEVLGFHGAYLLMTFLFGFMLFAMPCKRVTTIAR